MTSTRSAQFHASCFLLRTVLFTPFLYPFFRICHHALRIEKKRNSLIYSSVGKNYITKLYLLHNPPYLSPSTPSTGVYYDLVPFSNLISSPSLRGGELNEWTNLLLFYIVCLVSTSSTPSTRVHHCISSRRKLLSSPSSSVAGK